MASQALEHAEDPNQAKAPHFTLLMDIFQEDITVLNRLTDP